MAKTRLELKDEAANILATIAGRMGIPLAAANNALVFRYGGHMIETWEYKDVQSIQSFMPIPAPTIPIATLPIAETVDISELMAPMEF